MPATNDRYFIGDPTDPVEAIRQEMIEFRRRVDELEGRSGYAGGLRTLDPDTGTSLVWTGLLPDGSYGQAIFNQNGRVVQWASSEGFVAPQQAIPMFPNGSASISGSYRPGTTDSSFFELWRGDFWSTAPDIYYDLVVFPNAGNMDWRILVYEAGGSGVPQVGASGTGETSNTQRSGHFTIPETCLVPGTGTDPVGRPMTIRVEAKRNSGASQVDVAVAGPPINRTT